MDFVKCHEPRDRCGKTLQAGEMLRSVVRSSVAARDQRVPELSSWGRYIHGSFQPKK